MIEIKANEIFGSRTQILAMSLFWLVLMMLGNQIVPLPTFILYPAFLALFANLWISSGQYKESQQKVIRNIPYFRFVSATLFVVGLGISVFVNHYRLGPNDNQTLIALMLSLVLIHRIGTKVAIRGFYISGMFFLMCGWLAEFLGRVPTFYASGFSINPLGHRWAGLFSHPNAAGFCAALLTALGLLVFESRIFPLISFATLLLTENRGGAIALFGVLVLVILRFWSSASRLQKSFTLVLSSAVIALGPIFLNGREGSSDATTGRGPIWDYCLASLNDNAVFGHGPLFVLRSLGLSEVEWLRPQHCHNQLLDDLVNYGYLVGLIPFLTILLLLVVAVKRGSTEIICILGIVFIEGFWEPELRLFTPQAYLWPNLLILGVIYFWDLNEETVLATESFAEFKEPFAMPSTVSAP